ncbi:MAG: Asp23/Gls24 family envelope stress response protein [Candidatus Atribacteria bacterium]|nr:Asp23/Gls24 family envelope stress response protein [Candidatus Atribacteria bacterium]
MQTGDGEKINREKKGKKEQVNKIVEPLLADTENNQVKIDQEKIENDNLGTIKIAPEVLAMIVSRIVLNLKGVAGLVAHSKGGFGTLLGVKEVAEEVKIDIVDEKQISAVISVIIEYGSVIIDVAKSIQSLVKSEIEHKTGLLVKSIDINIIGIQAPGKNIKNTKKDK